MRGFVEKVSGSDRDAYISGTGLNQTQDPSVF